MSEGGMYPWKVQKIQFPKNGRPGNYANLSRPLPDPPKNHIWVQEANSRDWKLVPLVMASPEEEEEEEEMEESCCHHHDDDDHSSSSLPIVEVGVGVAATAGHHSSSSNNNNIMNNNNNNIITTAIPTSTIELAIPIDANNKIVHETSTFGKNNDDNNGIQYHQVQTTDTFQGICLQYKVTPTELRRANKVILMDSNFLTLHTKLIIPTSTNNSSTHTNIKSEEKTNKKRNCHHHDNNKEEKISTLLSQVSSFYFLSISSTSSRSSRLSRSEARAYLEMEDWDVHRAVQCVRDDLGWSTSTTTTTTTTELPSTSS